MNLCWLRDAEQRAQSVGVAPTRPQRHAIGQRYDILGVRQAVSVRMRDDVHDRRSMDAHVLRGWKHVLETVHRQAQQQLPAPGVYANVVAIGGNPVDLAERHPLDPIAIARDEMITVGAWRSRTGYDGTLHLAEQLRELPSDAAVARFAQVAFAHRRPRERTGHRRSA